MKILLLAGEESGMIYRGQIEKKVLETCPGAEIRGYGDYGFKTGDLAVMGIIQVLKRIFYFLRVKRTMEQAIDEWKPDVVCTVDYPGMNLKLAAYAKSRGIKTVHVVCPQVWAWHKSRIPKIERSVDKICCFLPFEPKIFRAGLAQFVGHPLAVEMERERLSCAEAEARAKEKVLAVLPGSRIGEIRHHMPRLMDAVGQLQREIHDLRVVIPAANAKAKKAIESHLAKANVPVEVRLGRARDVLRLADAAVVASGTATLEAALVNCPTVLVYHVDILFEIICRLILKGVKHIGLINIVCEKTSWQGQYPMPELIQQDFTAGNVVRYLRTWLTDEKANAQARSALADASRLLKTSDEPIDEIVRVLLAQ